MGYRPGQQALREILITGRESSLGPRTMNQAPIHGRIYQLTGAALCRDDLISEEIRCNACLVAL